MHLQPKSALGFLFISALVLGVSPVACDDGGDAVTGYVIDVVPESIDSFSTLTVRDLSGKVWEFGGGRFPAFTPSHLREHQVTGGKVKVTYRDSVDGKLQIIAIDDG